MTILSGWTDRKVLLAGAILCLFVNPHCFAENLRIGVAANFLSTLEKITWQFELAQGKKVDISAASTGALFAQVKNGAPFDIIFAADSERPALLESAGLTRLRQSYAIGQLVFWTPGASASDLTLRAFKGTLAIANPRHAPYGKAAMATLSRLGVKPHRLVNGTNVAQAFNFVKTGNAEAGLVALSQVRLSGADELEYWLVPASYHRPIEQQLVIMKNASRRAELFVDHLARSEISSLIHQSGYLLPTRQHGLSP